MKLIYGCAGEGKGHAARAAALWPYLSKNIELTIWAPQSITSFLSEKCPDIHLFEIPGIHFSLQGHKVDYWQTIVGNIPLARDFIKKTDEMAKVIKAQRVDGVISDFEPYTAIAAWKAGVPLLNLNHPAVVRRFPSLSPDAVSAKIVASMMTPPAQHNLICSFYDGDVGPILRQEISQVQTRVEDFILVYVKSSSEQKIKDILRSFPYIKFRYFPNKEDDFVDALASCRAVIAPAGHQLLSEALFLKKPVLAIPQKGQYEQRLNGQMLEASGWGMSTSVSKLIEDLPHFLEQLESFPKKADPLYKFDFTNSTPHTADRIHSFFDQAIQDEKLAPRVSCDFFNYMPTRVKRLIEQSA